MLVSELHQNRSLFLMLPQAPAVAVANDGVASAATLISQICTVNFWELNGATHFQCSAIFSSTFWHKSPIFPVNKKLETLSNPPSPKKRNSNVRAP